MGGHRFQRFGMRQAFLLFVYVWAWDVLLCVVEVERY